MLGFAQQTETPTSREVQPVVLKSNIERYNVDYKIINYTCVNGDSTILNHINLDELESHRSTTEDVQVIDPNTGFEIILFHKKNRVLLPVIK